VAAAALAGAAWLFVTGGYRSYVLMLLLALVAITMWSGASAAIQSARIKVRLPKLSAGRLARPLFVVASGTPLSEALRQRDEAHFAAAKPPTLGIADSAGRVVAIVDNHEVAHVPVERRPWQSVDTVARAGRLAAEASGEQVLATIQANPGEDLLVTVGEDVVGVLRVTDFISELSDRKGR